MKRNLLLFISLALILAVIAVTTVGCDSFTSPSTKASISSGAIVSQQNTGIWVTGEGKVSVVPDIANISLGVEAQATTVAEAQDQAAGAMNAVISELDRNGVAKKDIKTRQFSIYPVRRWVQEKEEEILVGYRVNNMVTAKVRKVEDTGTIIDAVARAGGDYTRINSISFTIDDPTSYHQEAREKAMTDAEAKAKQLADLGGVRLGNPTYINESGGSIPVPREYAVKVEAAAPAPATPISPGETEIQLTVQVVYYME
ncbi:SIMPL domain-containing protein [Chloroflexota bacterium]